jgi:hypothetical protein
MHIAIFSQKVRWFRAKELISILVVQGSIFMNDMGCGQHWEVEINEIINNIMFIYTKKIKSI